MNSSEDLKKKRLEQRRRDAVKDGLRAKKISEERFTSEAADFINFGLRNRKQKDKRKGSRRE